MSRHRNVRHLVDEDYDDYYDDDHYDDYDDYDDGYSGGTSTLTTPTKKNKGKAKAQTTTKPAVLASGGNSSLPTNAAKTDVKATTSTIPTTNNTLSPKATTSAVVSPVKVPVHHTSITTADVAGGTTTTSSIAGQNNTTISSTAATTTEAATLPSPPVPPIELTANGKTSTKKPLLTVVILGHVDAGKSTVTGHLLHLLQNKTTTTTTATNSSSSSISNSGSASLPNPRKQHQPKTSSNNNNNNNNQNFAWLLDEDEQERIHGVTMDIATKQLELPNNLNLILLDAPGHADFVPAMITGAAAADAAVLTVDVTDPQTLQKGGTLKEHVYVAKGLGVNQVLILLNKMDIVGFGNADLYHSLERQLREFLRTAGYPPHKVRCIPVSGLTGVNIVRRRSSSNDNDDDGNTSEAERTLRQWYKGPTVVEALDEFDIPPQQSKLLEKPLRMVVADVIEGSNAITVRAKIVSGWLQQGEKLVLLPVGDIVSLTKIQSLHNPTDSNRTAFGSGELLDAIIIGLSDAQRISPGSLLARPSNRPPLASRCRARIFVLDITIPLIRGAQAIFHMHNLDIPCHLKSLVRTLETDGTTVKKENPRALVKNTSAIVELQLSVPTCIEAFTDCRALGRFVLRRSGDSVAVGRIEEVLL